MVPRALAPDFETKVALRDSRTEIVPELGSSQNSVNSSNHQTRILRRALVLTGHNNQRCNLLVYCSPKCVNTTSRLFDV